MMNILCSSAVAFTVGVGSVAKANTVAAPAVTMQFAFPNPFEGFDLQDFFGNKKSIETTTPGMPTIEELKELCRDEESSGCELYDIGDEVFSKRVVSTKKVHATRTASGIHWEPDEN